MEQIYTAGTLLWVDDDFVYDGLDQEGQEIAAWRKTFGDTDSRIYRLLGLQLEIATSKEDAFEVIDQLRQLEHQHRFVQAVLDLRIPPTPGERGEMKFGLDVARKLKDAQIPFVFLSSSSSAMQELAERGLDRIPYFKKATAASPTMMPDHLVRHLLGEFRNRISWLDIQPILSRFDSESHHPLKKMRLCDRYFPFFGSYRDFVERCEARSGRQRTMRTVLRAPRTHSNGFVAQCLAIAIGGASSALRPRFVFLDSTQHDVFEQLQRTTIRDDGRLCLALRLLGHDLEVEQRILESALNLRTALFFILPQDEGADPFLRTLSSEPNVTYDDLPETRLHDRLAREDLIRRTAAFTLQEVRLSTGEGRPRSLAPIFQRHPEILIHPVNWTFLLEAEEIADDVMDPDEILGVLDTAVQHVARWSPDCIEALIGGYPPPNRTLLQPAQASYENRKGGHPNWIRRAFREWLKTSWRTPHGAISDRHDRLNEQLLLEWEDHCLEVALELAQLFITHSYPELIEGNKDPELEFLAAAARFLMHPAICKMMEQRAGPDDWVGFEAVRWPHAAFPLPAALNRKLKQEGRYLWVQTDLLDQVTVIRGGQRAVDRLEVRAQLHHNRLAWFASALGSLPRGWKEPAGRLLKVIEQRQIDSAWRNSEQRRQVWSDLYSFVLNATPVSYLFWSIIRNAGEVDESAVRSLTKVQGAGRLLECIRPWRAERMSSIFEPAEPRTRSWLQGVEDVSIGFSFLRQFERRMPDWSTKIQPDRIFSFFSETFEKLGLADPQQLTTAEVERAGNNASQRLFQALYDPEGRLQGNDLFDDFQMEDRKEPKLPEWSPLRFGASRGLNIDYIMNACDSAEQLRAVIRPLVYMDGYHFLALLWDLRNLSKQVPDVDSRIIHTVFERFILGFEGLVSQLKWCLAACGRRDLASSIPNATLKLKGLPEYPVAGLDQALRVAGRGADDYAVFTLGMPGRMAWRLAFALAEERLVLFDEPEVVAAE